MKKPEAPPDAPAVPQRLRLVVLDEYNDQHALLLRGTSSDGVVPVSGDCRRLLRSLVEFCLHQEMTHPGRIEAQCGPCPPWPHDDEHERSWIDGVLCIVGELGI